MKNKKFFFEILIKWTRNENKRQMPWKGEKDPYKIWISEIILQQTRVQQGLEYYNRFIKKWPSVKELANAPDQDIYKQWEGLGYYSRCKNLITTAKYITNELDGRFPERYEDILSLSGIGDYTAAAIASFAFNQPYAVVDGNVFRILARFFGIKMPVYNTEGKKVFKKLANELIEKNNPAEYNQAIMDFGAVVCKPAAPLCSECPLSIKCIAFQKGIVNALPVKEKSIKQRKRFFNYLLVEQGSNIYINQRTDKDIWQNLYEFILVETEELVPEDEFLQSSKVSALFGSNEFKVNKISRIYHQKLTHQIITGRFFHIKIKNSKACLMKYKSIPVSQLKNLAFPKFIASYLQD